MGGQKVPGAAVDLYSAGSAEFSFTAPGAAASMLSIGHGAAHDLLVPA